jgi:hypothetical protein
VHLAAFAVPTTTGGAEETGVFYTGAEHESPENTPRRMTVTHALWTYLVVVVVFAFGFLCASAFTLGDD